MMVAAGLLAAWKTLPGLLVGRFITGVVVGLAAGTAFTYLIELRALAKPGASPVPAQTIGSATTVGALGLGPLIAGCLAEWAGSPLTVPYLLFVALGAIALIGLAATPETSARVATAQSRRGDGGRSRSAAVLVPGALATLAAFAANGLFAGLSGLFLATTLHHDTRCRARRCSWCSLRAWRLNWQPSDSPRRACSCSARSRCFLVSRCS
jgi:MFS family permease